MAALAKPSRDVHRSALLLAAIPLLLDGSLSVYIAYDLANRLWEQHGNGGVVILLSIIRPVLRFSNGE